MSTRRQNLSGKSRDFSGFCYNLIRRAGTDALVTILVSMVSIHPKFLIYRVEAVEAGDTVDTKEVQ